MLRSSKSNDESLYRTQGGSSGITGGGPDPRPERPCSHLLRAIDRHLADTKSRLAKGVGGGFGPGGARCRDRFCRYRYPRGMGTGTRSYADGDGAVMTVSDLFTLTLTQHDDAWWFCARIIDGHRDEVVRLAALDIVRRLLEPSPEAFASWAARHGGGPAHDEPTRAVLKAYLLADFADAGNETRLQGAVVEHLWACMAASLAGGWGMPLHVEHEHFSVIDHGGDGLSLYDFGAPDLRFRLWESKRHDSATKSVTTVITGAAGQLKEDAASYLARMSKPLQLNDDLRIQLLAGKIVKLWTTQDPAGGVGVSVGTTVAQALPERPFQGLRKAFSHFPSSEHREGVVIEIPDLAAFAADVRAEILKGIE